MRSTSVPTRQTPFREHAPPSKSLCTTCCTPKRSPPSAQSSLHSVQHFRLRIQQARSGVCKVVCSESARAAKQIKQAATSQKVQPYLALGAALWVEQHSDSNTDSLVDLDGRWQLVFASTSGSTLFWYIPVKEFKDIDVKSRTLSLVSLLGPVTTSFDGSYNTLSKQDMRFSFNALVITVFGRTVVKKPISFAEKVYTYYWLHQGLACARSSGGGIVLLRRLET
ncbi:hypothetical protein WJX82_001812 [Trebouxia sp. C0006]